MNRAGRAPLVDLSDEASVRRERMYKPMETAPLHGSTPAEDAGTGDELEPAAREEEYTDEATLELAGVASPGESMPRDRADAAPAVGPDNEPPEAPPDFETLFEAYYRPLSSFLYRMVGDLQLAQDLTQDCFIKLHLALKAGQPLANARAWLYRVATNAALDERRRRRRILWLPLLTGSEHAEPEQQDPEEQVALRDRLQQVLGGISPNLAVCLLLHLHHGFSHDEIAAMLGITSGAARTRLQRGREAFKARWLATDGRGASGRNDASAPPGQNHVSRHAPSRGRSATHAEEDNGGTYETSDT